MKELFDLLSVCRKNGIHFTLDDSGKQLKMQGNIAALCQDQISMLKSNKEEIIALLRKPVQACWAYTLPALQTGQPPFRPVGM